MLFLHGVQVLRKCRELELENKQGLKIKAHAKSQSKKQKQLVRPHIFCARPKMQDKILHNRSHSMVDFIALLFYNKGSYLLKLKSLSVSAG